MDDEWATDPPDPVQQSLPPPAAGTAASDAVGGEAAGADQSWVRIRKPPPDARVIRIWRTRVLIMIAVGVLFSVIISWRLGLTLATLAGIADVIYRSHRAAKSAVGRRADARRRTRRQLARIRRAGYLSLDARPIPSSREVIDHLVVGPSGVYAINSEKWHRKLPIRTRNGEDLWHGSNSKKQHVEHARWEAEQASELLSAATGTKIDVRPVMVIYGPRILRVITSIRDVDVLNGLALVQYLRRRSRADGIPQLSREQVENIYAAAVKIFPDIPPQTDDSALREMPSSPTRVDLCVMAIAPMGRAAGADEIDQTDRSEVIPWRIPPCPFARSTFQWI